MINSRNLNELIPIVQAMAHKFLSACTDAGIDVLITSTYRDNESQNALYAQGRTTPGKFITNAKGGESMHNYRCAFDFVPMIYGKAVWDDIDLFRKCGEIAEKVGLDWSGKWSGRFRELAHCQYTGGLTLADLRSGKKIT
jgi:peptidoglycan L-alanyl-D-glutamate endopeptidase CwlK